MDAGVAGDEWLGLICSHSCARICGAVAPRARNAPSLRVGALLACARKIEINLCLKLFYCSIPRPRSSRGNVAFNESSRGNVSFKSSLPPPGATCHSRASCPLQGQRVIQELQHSGSASTFRELLNELNVTASSSLLLQMRRIVSCPPLHRRMEPALVASKVSKLSTD